MIELPLIFLAGILGSSHCLGMCGPFAIAIGSRGKSWRGKLARQAIYTCGRVFTYAILGAVAGYAGWRLANHSGWLRNSASVLAIVAGLFLLYQGLLAAGVLRRRAVRATATVCWGPTMLATFLHTPVWTNVFLAGLFTGLLPCGLVYGFLALAASSSNLARGVVVMVAFGLGTAPIMIVTGTGASLLSLRWRKTMYRVAAWCVVVTGILSIGRGAGFLDFPGWMRTSGCPACSKLDLPAPPSSTETNDFHGPRTVKSAAANATPRILNKTTITPTPTSVRSPSDQ
jgi:sulfite exporter TauE/SafE